MTIITGIFLIKFMNVGNKKTFNLVKTFTNYLKFYN